MDDIAFHFFCRNGIKNIFSHPNKIGSDNKKTKNTPIAYDVSCDVIF